MVLRELSERTSVKDVIEASGVPHTEVDRIVVGRDAVNFSHVLDENSDIEVHSVDVTQSSNSKHGLQCRRIDKFVLDGHLGTLARNLRLLGIDIAYASSAEDRQLLEIMQRDGRALITRDRRLLMHSIVENGYCPRSSDGEKQTLEVLRRFDLGDRIAPFTRCLACNAPIEKIDKTEVYHRLEPLTKVYYEQFRSCSGCGKIYWSGSHFDKLVERVNRIRTQLEQGTNPT